MEVFHSPALVSAALDGSQSGVLRGPGASGRDFALSDHVTVFHSELLVAGGEYLQIDLAMRSVPVFALNPLVPGHALVQAMAQCRGLALARVESVTSRLASIFWAGRLAPFAVLWPDGQTRRLMPSTVAPRFDSAARSPHDLRLDSP